MGLHVRHTFVAPARRARIAASLATGLGVVSCARPPPEPSGWVRDGCSVQAFSPDLRLGESSRAPVLRVGLPQIVRFRPRDTASGEDERVVFQHVYETLVATDCGNRALPGLAAQWTPSEQGRRWDFALRPGASFSDGTPVDAAAIRASWRRTRVAGVTVDSVVGKNGAGGITIHLAAPGVQEPRAFAHPDLSVRRVPRGSGWPLGTGPYRVASASDDRTVSLHPVRASTEAAAAPRLQFEAVTASRARNLLDLGWEAVLTRDRRVTQYAADIPRLGAVELPWDRTYVLVVPSTSGFGVDPVPAGLLDVLARDAVRAQARPFPGRMELGEHSEARCRVAGPPTVAAFAEAAHPPDPPAPPAPIRRIGYDRDDPTAAGLAARLVALGGGRTAHGEDAPARFLAKALGLENQPDLAAELRALPMSADSLRRLMPAPLGSAPAPPGSPPTPQISPPAPAHAYVIGLPTVVPACVRIPGYHLFPLIMTRLTLIMDRRLGRVLLGPGGLPMFANSIMSGS